MAVKQTHRSSTSLYVEVTDRIIRELEEGRLPWVQPWDSATSGFGLPCNAGTGRRYSGINVLILWQALFDRGFRSQGWLTYRQALQLGGNVRRGESGTTICYADRFTPRKRDTDDAEREGGEVRQQIAFLKRFTVFNVDQCEGLREDLGAGTMPPLGEREAIPHADALIEATGVDIRIGGDHAFYVPSADYVRIPHQQAYRDQINWYRTALHELSHWTGHASRLNRFARGMGREAYGREELVAEMGSAFVCAELGVVPTVRHADYLACWLEILREDSKAIFRAASQASKAADWLLAFRASDASQGAVA